MSNKPDANTGPPEIEEMLRAALNARAGLVRPEDLTPLAPPAEVRPRWQSPWVLLATAAVVLLILGVVLQGIGREPRSDDLAPKPDDPQVTLPADIGRDWEADDLSTPARLDLDGDGVEEKVEFLAEETENYDGRIRLQTTLSATGEEAYGIAELGSTIGTTALDPIDADVDGDQELVLYHDDPRTSGPGGGGHPLVFDLRDGLLVQAVVEDPELLVRGQVPVSGEGSEHYEMVHVHDYWVEDGRLRSSRSVSAFAAGNMMLMRPERTVLDTWEWGLGDDGVLRPEPNGCLVQTPDARADCDADEVDAPPVVDPVATGTIGTGESAEFADGYRFTVRLEAGADPSLVVEGDDGRTLRHGLGVTEPRVSTVQPISVFSDGASVLVTSAADPTVVEVLVQAGDTMRPLRPVGEIPLATTDGARTWLTRGGTLVTIIADGGEEADTWQAWQWVMVSRTEMAAFPTGTVCFADLEEGLTTPC